GGGRGPPRGPGCRPAHGARRGSGGRGRRQGSAHAPVRKPAASPKPLNSVVACASARRRGAGEIVQENGRKYSLYQICRPCRSRHVKKRAHGFFFASSFPISHLHSPECLL